MFFKPKIVRILTIDGGGIRGLIPSVVLKLFQDKYLKGPAAGQFDLIAGNSIGGIVALLLGTPSCLNQERNAPFSVEDVVEILKEKGPGIFPKKQGDKLLAHVLYEKYSIKPFEEIMKMYFCDHHLSDLTNNTLITAYDLERRCPYLFKHIKGHTPEIDFSLYDVARATTAAPTYFPPHMIEVALPGGDKSKFCFVDGVFCANNPALYAVMEAKKHFPRAKKYVVLSLGVGKNAARFPYEKIKRWGYVDWISPMHGVPLVNMIIDGQMDTTEYLLNLMDDVEFFRVNGTLGKSNYLVDDVSPRNLKSLEATGKHIFLNNQEIIEKAACYF